MKDKIGIKKEYWANGQIKWETPYKNGERDGIAKYWYEDGQIGYEILYKNGKRDGIEKYWYDNGQIKYILIWKQDKLIKRLNNPVEINGEYSDGLSYVVNKE